MLVAWGLALCLVMAAWMSSGLAQRPGLLDGFEAPAPWQVGVSDGVRASLRTAAGYDVQELCVDFDFAGVAGYASARRAMPIDFPANYAFTFYMRGEAPVNSLEIKFIDASGDNVWWMHRRDFAWPQDWQQVTMKKRHIEFAWGPTAERVLTRSAAIEFVISAGSGGGSGSVCFDQLRLQELPPPPPSYPPVMLQASSEQPGAAAAAALDGSLSTAWQHQPGDAAPVLQLDFQHLREFGGVVLHRRQRWPRPALSTGIGNAFPAPGAARWAVTPLRPRRN
jgi:hypothetical protein